MNEQQMNNMLKQQIEAETPDILNDLLAELPAQDGAEKVVPMERARRRRVPFMAAVLAAAACLAVGLLGGNFLSGVRQVKPAGTVGKAEKGAVVASVAFDVNPSVKMTIDKDNRVLDCEAINDEGKEILGEMDLEGSDVVVAAYAVIGGMLTNGYLTDATNSVLVSVSAPDKAKGEEIEDYLSTELKAYLENSSVGAAIVGQYVQDDQAVQDFAAKHGISEGKAWIIKQLVASDKRMTEASLLKLTTQELMVLWTNRQENKLAEPSARQPRKQQAGSSLHGTVNTKNYIPAETALNNALKYAGISRSQARDIDVEFECEDGIVIYEVDFKYGGREYGIDVRADNGKIVGGTPGKASVTQKRTDYDDDDDDYDDDDDDRPANKKSNSKSKQYDDDDDDDDDDRPQQKSGGKQYSDDDDDDDGDDD